MAESMIEKSDHVHWGSVSNFNFETSWTAPEDGILTVTIQKTSGDGSCAWYVRDVTNGIWTFGATSTKSLTSGYQNSICFPVIKGHVYQEEFKENVYLKRAHFFPIAY